MIAGRRAVIWAALACGIACGGNDADDDGAVGSDGGAGEVECPAELAGPAMVAVPSPSGAEYCIDTTEVTMVQYQAFLDADPALEPPGRCDGDTTFAPLAEAQCDGANDVTARPDHPVTCVDWCDAWAYCAWAGKHLCGQIGGEPLGESGAIVDANVNQWYGACSSMGDNEFAYGDGWEVGTCNSGPDDLETTVPPAEVGSFPECHGTEAPFDRIFDMSGNASEWIDACDDEGGVSPYCWEMGGSSISRQLSSCGSSVYVPWDDVWWHKGFRCCWDP